MRVGVIGLGDLGLPLAVAFAERNNDVDVVGADRPAAATSPDCS
jgi:UDP-N-acetyl-D-mannosaminuronate dehydrogenase